eukprot:gnl/TRDRNA2_/TRDRNA2_175665_c1_seq2.p1 gnl/TRDRNA2_/TRDRNA2_175665_c1~~gnl/TRDRNA2_/TRDRNA2_175665_c1_seq2.p1  ORF type:complete len:241 (-),score=13.21 gnl/TRDRNA2_/TRDRNA2_175665_c1_seq2:356-1078(-)
MTDLEKLSGTHFILDLYLMSSAKGVRYDFSWIYAGLPFLERPAWCKNINPTSEIIRHAGYLWVYYDFSPCPYAHCWNRSFSAQTMQNKAKVLLARFDEGRMVGIMPEEDQGTLITKGFQFEPSQQITIDIDTRRLKSQVILELVPGSANVTDAELLSLHTRYSLAQAGPFQGMNGKVRVQWGRSIPEEFRARIVHLRFVLTNATVFGFGVSHGSNEPAGDSTSPTQSNSTTCEATDLEDI